MRNRAFQWIGQFLAGEAIKQWLWPLLPTAGGAVIGYIQGVPWFYLYVGVAFLFAAISTGLVRFDEWLYRNKVEDKLVFRNIRVGKGDDASGRIFARLGVIMENEANFPVNLEIQDFNTSIGGFYPPKKDYGRRKFRIRGGGGWWYDDYDIELPAQSNSVLEGHIQCIFRYGKNGNYVDKTKMKS